MKAHHIIVTGPESSGKTTLSKQLAELLGGVWIPEYPRGYLEAIGRKAEVADFDHFVAANANLVEAGYSQAKRKAADDARPYIVQDTGAEVLHLWMQDKFEQVNPSVKQAFSAQRPKLYLLCRPDLPWEYDPLREDPHRRDELFVKLRALLSSRSSVVVEVSGFDESRINCARAAIKDLRG